MNEKSSNMVNSVPTNSDIVSQLMTVESSMSQVNKKLEKQSNRI